MKTLVFVLSVLVMAPIFGQSLLPVALTSTADDYQNGSVEINISCGEPFTETLQSNSAILTTGFFQGNLMSTHKMLLKLFPEGLYAGNGTLTKVHDISGPMYPGSTADLVGIKLHSAANYSHILFSNDTLPLSTAGIVSFDVPGFVFEPCYLSLQHRNALLTVSSSPILLSSYSLHYDFTDSASKAYGNNLKALDGVFVLFTGDVDQNGLIDLEDMQQIAQQANLFATGFAPEDLNGDGGIDALDMILCDNNAALQVEVVTP